MVVVDYLQLCVCRAVEAQGRYQEQKEIMRRLKELAQELQIQVLVVSQVPFSLSIDDDMESVMKQLGETISIEFADTVLWLRSHKNCKACKMFRLQGKCPTCKTVPENEQMLFVDVLKNSGSQFSAGIVRQFEDCRDAYDNGADNSAKTDGTV